MSTALDMSLDDMIKNSRGNRERTRGGRAPRGRGGPRGSFNAGRMAAGRIQGGRMTGAVRRGPLPVNTRPSSYTIAKSTRRTKRFPWQPDLFEDSIRAAGISGIEIGTKLYVSNLDYGVTNEDIRELFSEIGELKRYAVHFDKNGRPSGSAEVVYTRRSDAFAALKRYNNVLLDGKPMKIEIVGANAGMPISARVNVTGAHGDYMVCAKDLKIIWARDRRYWRWVKDTDDSDVAELLNVCWLKVSGKIEKPNLSPGTQYEVVLVAKMKTRAYGWDAPVNFRFSRPGGMDDWTINLENEFKDSKDQWKDIKLGEFTASENRGDIEFWLYKFGGKWKSGLVIKGVAVRPKS